MKLQSKSNLKNLPIPLYFVGVLLMFYCSFQGHEFPNHFYRYSKRTEWHFHFDNQCYKIRIKEFYLKTSIRKKCQMSL